MITEMFIEGNPVDVSENLSTLLTMAIDDIKDFSSRNTTFSKTIVLPGTARNNQVFGNVFEMQSVNPYDASLPNVLTNFNAAKSAGCYIFQDNIQVFRGVVRILEIVIDRGRKEYEVAVFGELGGLVASLGNQKLEDLDFSAYNMSFSLANIVASWDNAPGSGVFFPLTDYGNYSTDKHNWQFGTFRPALYVKEYLDKIFAATNYSYSCALFGTARFKNLVIPHNAKLLTRLSNTALNIGVGDHSYTVASGSYSETMALTTHNTMGNFTTADSLHFTYGAAAPLTGSLSLKIPFHMTASGTSNLLRVIVYKNGTSVELGRQDFTTSSTNVFDSIDIEIAGVIFNNTDNLSVFILINQPGTVELLSTSLVITSDITLSVPVNLGEALDINSTLPKNILQVDFLTSIIKLFNLYIYDDPGIENRLIITPYLDFYSSDPSASVDWTYKLDRSQPVHIKPMSELNSRYYHFAFKSDSDYWNDLYSKRYNQNYGDFIYDSAFDFTQDETKIELIFSGTPLVGYQGEDKIYSTIFKRTGTTTLVEENVDSNIRILQTKKVTGVSSWNILQGTTVLGSYTAYGYAGHLDDPNAPANDIHFGVPKELFFTLVSGALNVNQFNTYWSPYLAEITDKDSRLMTAMFRLNPADIYNLDFSKLVLVDGSLFRINKITDYNASNPALCQVELLKVIQLLY